MKNLKEGRIGFENFGNAYPVAVNITRKDVTVSGVSCAWFIPAGAGDNDIVFYIHGGGFIYGSLNSHAPMVSYIARELNCKVLAIDYRLAPENPFPAGIDDCIAVINAITEQYPQIRFGIIGDSAGGNLTMATQLILKETKGPMPEYSIIISPWLDMECKNESYLRNKTVDTILSIEYVRGICHLYAPGRDITNPLLSPVNGNLKGLAPVLIMCGTYEILEDDAIHLQEQLLANGVEVELERFEGQLHVWPLVNIHTDASHKALRDMARFATKHSSVK